MKPLSLTQISSPLFKTMNFSNQEAVAEFEQASNHAQHSTTHSTAEKSLKQLSARPDALFLALTIIDRDISPIACFHAAAILRSALSKNWKALQPHQRNGPNSVYSWLISKVTSNSEMPSFQRRSLLRAAAFTARRSYLETNHDQRISLFTPLLQKVPFNLSTVHSFIVRNELVELIADEFLSQAVLSQNFIEQEILVQTRLLFASPGGGIEALFRIATESLFSMYGAKSSSTSVATIQQIAIPAIHTLLKVLTTDLTFPISFDIQIADSASLCDYDMYYGSDVLENMCNTTFEKDKWFPLTSSIPGLLEVCFMIVEALSDVNHNPAEPRLLSLTSQVIIAISSISKRSYGSSQTAQIVLTKLLDGMQEQNWFSSPFTNLQLAYADIWRRISLTYGLASLSSLMGNRLDLFKTTTCQLVARQKSNEESSLEVTNMLLESWTKLVYNLPHLRDAHHQLSSCIQQIVVCYLESSLQRFDEGVLRATLHQEAGDSDMFADSSVETSILSFAAVLTRYVLDDGIISGIQHSWLCLAQKVSLWDASSTNAGFILDGFLNDFLFLIRYVGAVVADEVEGEYPSVPILILEDLNRYPAQARQNGSQPYARVLISVLTEAAKLESNLFAHKIVVQREASQKIASELLNALLRVCKTYFVSSDEDRAEEIFGALGDLSFIEMCIDCCFQKVHEALQHHNMDSEVAVSATRLLFALASGASKYTYFQKPNHWQEIIHVSSIRLLNLPVMAVQNIGNSLAYVFGAEATGRLVVPALNSIHSSVATQQHNHHAITERANNLVSVIHLLRGVARSEKTSLETQELLLNYLFKSDGLALACIRRFGNLQPSIGLVLIGLAEDVLLVTLPHMCDTEGRVHLANIVELMKLQARTLDIETNDVVDLDVISKNIEQILSLLFEVVEGHKEIDVSEACYNGALIVLHLLHKYSLPHPATNVAAMRFVWKLLYWYADDLWLLTPDSAKVFLRMIDPQRHSIDAFATRLILDAIIALAEASSKSRVEGPSASIIEEALDGFTNSILAGLAYRSEYVEGMKDTSEALLLLLQVKCKRCNTTMQEFEHALMVLYGSDEKLRNIIRPFAVSACDTAQSCLTLKHSSNRTDRIYSSWPSSKRGVPANTFAQLARSFRDTIAKFSVDIRALLLLLNSN